MNKKYLLYVDDERICSYAEFLLPTAELITVRNYKDAIDFLWHHREGNVFIDLDHDLGEEKTGYDICKFIIENEIPLLGAILHTMNPVGRQNMKHLLTHYGYAVF